MPDIDIETQAQAVEAHPDYQVQRRLVSRQAYAVSDGRPLSKGVVVDTETTGLANETDKIIELCVLAFEYDPDSAQVFRILDVYDGLEDPGIPIPAQSTSVHGITDAMVEGKRIDDEKVGAMVAGADLVIAHNAGFDRPFVESRLPAFASLAWACSLEQVDWNTEGFGARTLEHLGYKLGFFFDAHRAEADCRAVLEVLQRPLPQSNATGLKQLLEQYRRKTYRIWARGSAFETKDILKAHAYRWDSNQRCWYKVVAEEEGKEEIAWLKATVYGGRASKIDIEIYDPYCRYSARSGKTIARMI
jgi:DNA polymerase-3 subunit epsilon